MKCKFDEKNVQNSLTILQKKYVQNDFGYNFSAECRMDTFFCGMAVSSLFTQKCVSIFPKRLSGVDWYEKRMKKG
jgi:hypothetical protein